MTLGPLSEADVNLLVADTVHCSLAEAAPLARLVRDRTGGNPFFAIQFLSELYRQGLIAFDRGMGRWHWDVARIRAQRHTDNVVELMVSKLRDLPPETQEALRLAAGIGATVDADTLAIALQRDAEPALRPALEGDLLLRLEHVYRFPHDRVQEAAYSLTPERERAAMHLQIGRLLLAHTRPETLDEQIFDLVPQLNRGAALISSPLERERLAELNLVAGKRAQGSTAHDSALQYFAAGEALLAEDTWERRYPLRFALELHRAECEYLTGAFAPAEERLSGLLRRARDLVDAAAVTLARIDLYSTLSRSDRAVEACLEYLRRIGVDWSPHPTCEEVHREYERLWQSLGDRRIEALVDLPRVVEPEWRATMDVLSAIQASAKFTDENLHCLVIARTVNLSLAHGNSDGSCEAYVGLGMILGPHFGNYRAAFRFGKLGFDLMEKHGLLRFKARVYLAFGGLVNPWTSHVRTSLELVRRSFDAAQENGDLQYSCYAYHVTVNLLLVQGEPLGNVQQEAETGIEFVRKAKFGLVVDIMVTQERLIRALRGLTDDLGSFNDDRFDDRDLQRHLESDPHLALPTCFYFIRKLQVRYYAGDYASALEAAAKAQPLLWTSIPFLEMAEYHFYRALALAAICGEASPDEQRTHREALRAHLTQLEVWAENGPRNFGNRAALVGAEIARLDGENDRAAQLYERAIRSARDNGFVHNEAIAYETAARFYRARGFALIADTYLREARDRYLRWGADGKVRQLERLYPQLVEKEPLGQAATLALRPEELDLVAVVKASQTISGVMVREQLLRTLLRVVLEEGGARRARLLLVRDGELKTVAETNAGEVEPAPPSDSAVRVPASILKYVQRTQERVLLDDAASDAGRFSGDPYFAHAHPRSLLCLPIRRQAEVVALLYLENDLMPGAFTPERLLALELLAAQAAISLENALLLEHEHAGRVEAEAASRRALLLAEATTVMSSTFDYQGVFGALTRLCVRWLADWAVIDLADGGEVVRLAGAHRDPDKEPLLRDLSERYPARAGTPTPVTSVLLGGAPIHLTDMSEEQTREYCVDERHFELAQRLGVRSVIIAPLMAREARLGALTLVSATPHRFGPADVELVAEMGHRAALAIDNARLLHETQRAVRVRDEFLCVASHELRTPTTSLKLAVQALLRSAATRKAISAETLDHRLNLILRKTERLQQLTDELLDVTRIEQGRLELQLAEVELGSLVREVVEHFELELAAARCPVPIACVAPVVGMWDAARLVQVVSNLLSNAIKFGTGRPIEIHICEAGGVAELVVKDHGIGIDPARLPHVFDRFERAVPHQSYGGLGLGLYITRWIVRAHGGTIRVESRPGVGSTFTVELPCIAPVASGIRVRA